MPNANGDRAFLNRTTLTPNPRFFDHCDAVLDILESMGFAVYIVILWWNQIMNELRGGPPETSTRFGRWIGARWRHRNNLLWVVGGDTPWRMGDLAHFRALAEGVRASNATQLISFHPQSEHSSSDHLNAEAWLSFNSVQVHRDPQNVALHALGGGWHTGLPTLVAETNYYWHRRCASVYGIRFCIHGDERMVRASHWAARLGGGSFGEAYGAWPFWTGVAPSEEWRPALTNQPAASQIATTMQAILHQHTWHQLTPDVHSLVVHRSHGAEGHTWPAAATTRDGREVLIYFPHRQSTAVTVNLTWFANAIEVTWYSARTGMAVAGDRLANDESDRVFDPHACNFLLDEEDLLLSLRALPPPPSPPTRPPPRRPPMPSRSPSPLEPVPSSPAPLSPSTPPPRLKLPIPREAPFPPTVPPISPRGRASDPSWMRAAVAGACAVAGLAAACLARRGITHRAEQAHTPTAKPVQPQQVELSSAEPAAAAVVVVPRSSPRAFVRFV